MPRTFDEAALLERVEQDMEFLRETVDMLGNDGRAFMAEVRRGVDAGDAGTVSRAAHTLKGMISNFCAADVQASAAVVERMGRDGDLAAGPTAVTELEGQLEALIAELNDFLGGKSRCES